MRGRHATAARPQLRPRLGRRARRSHRSAARHLRPRQRGAASPRRKWTSRLGLPRTAPPPLAPSGHWRSAPTGRPRRRCRFPTRCTRLRGAVRAPSPWPVASTRPPHRHPRGNSLCTSTPAAPPRKTRYTPTKQTTSHRQRPLPSAPPATGTARAGCCGARPVARRCHRCTPSRAPGRGRRTARRRPGPAASTARRGRARHPPAGARSTAAIPTPPRSGWLLR
mmetsp:Transcript_59389/g.181144  ORF Transcript_59389/g.181144 Transcript_59389/m.181144 type:complete len:223 (+) Transcript_59389:503-1171(+)